MSNVEVNATDMVVTVNPAGVPGPPGNSGGEGPRGPRGLLGPTGKLLNDAGLEVVGGDSFSAHGNRYLTSNPQATAAWAPSDKQYNAISFGNRGTYSVDGRAVRATHNIILGNSPTGGDYRLRYGAFVTAPIAWNSYGRDLQAAQEIIGNFDWIIGGAAIAGGNSQYGLTPSRRRDSLVPTKRWHPPLPTVEENNLTNAGGPAPTITIAESFGDEGPMFLYYPSGVIPTAIAGRFTFLEENVDDDSINCVLGACLNSFGESSIQVASFGNRIRRFYTEKAPVGTFPPTSIVELDDVFLDVPLEKDGITENVMVVWFDRQAQALRVFINDEEIADPWVDDILNAYWNHTIGVQIRRPGPLSGDAEWIEWAAGAAVDLAPQSKIWNMTCLSDANIANMPTPGLPVMDGVQVALNDKVFLPSQTDKKQNGQWVVAEPKWLRHPAQPTGLLFRTRAVQIARGSKGAGTVWQCNSSAGVVVDVGEQDWERRDALILTRTANGGNAQDLDFRLYNQFIITATQPNGVLNFINSPPKGCFRVVFLKQSVGGQTWTLPSDIYYTNPMPYFPTLRAGAMDKLEVTVLPDGTKVVTYYLDVKPALALRQKVVNNTLASGSSDRITTNFDPLNPPVAGGGPIVAVWAPRTPFANTLAPPAGWVVRGFSDRGATLTVILLQWTGAGVPAGLTMQTNGPVVYHSLNLLEFSPVMAGGNVPDGALVATDGGAGTLAALPLSPAAVSTAAGLLIGAVHTGVAPTGVFGWNNNFIVIPGTSVSDRLSVAYKTVFAPGNYGANVTWPANALVAGFMASFK